MKTNIGKVFATLLCMMMCLSLYAQESHSGAVIGLWNFSAPDAPYGYQEGTCQIKKTGDNLSAVFTISGTEMTVKEIKKETDTYKCNFMWTGPMSRSLSNRKTRINWSGMLMPKA